MENKKFFLEISGNEDDLLAFMSICQFIQECEIKGTCRSLKLTVDGDGSASLKFRWGTTPLLEPEELPRLRSNLDEVKDIWIGE